jgi:hypothetical protein
MNIVRDDLRRLRPQLALAAALVVAGAACLIASDSYLDSAKRTRDAVRQSRIQAQDRVSKVSEEEREIRDNLVYFDQMRQHGMIGEQNRLDWIESIAKIKNDRKLFEIKYSIEAQKALDYPGIVATGSADFVVSRMKLDMMLLHEEDLLDFLSDLDSAGKAQVSVRRCSLTRIDRGGAPVTGALQPRLHAECQVDLISVRSLKPA